MDNWNINNSGQLRLPLVSVGGGGLKVIVITILIITIKLFLSKFVLWIIYF